MILASAARRSALMRYMHMKLMELPIFVELKEKFFVYHEFGVGNALSDKIARP